MQLKRVVLVLFGCFWLAGCGTNGLVTNLFNGEPNIDDHVWLLSEPTSDGSHDFRDAGNHVYLPPPCVAHAGATPANVNGNSTNTQWSAVDPYKDWKSDQINSCVYAMIDLVDLRFGHYEDALIAANSGASSFVDVSIIGMSAAGSLLGGPTSQILNAASSALSGTLGKLNNDILQAKTIDIILQQMRTGRAAQAIVINAKLHPKDTKTGGYTSMYEAANDIYAYARAGSWTEALISLQASAGAQSQACANRENKDQIDTAHGLATPTTPAGTAPSNAEIQCPSGK